MITSTVIIILFQTRFFVISFTQPVIVRKPRKDETIIRKKTVLDRCTSRSRYVEHSNARIQLGYRMLRLR